MKTKIAGIVVGLCALFASYAQTMTPGTYTTTLTWSPYPATNESDGLYLYVGTSPGVWQSTNILPDTATQYVVTGGVPGQVYYSTIRAFAADGRLSPPVSATWTNPIALPPVMNFRPSVIIYVGQP